MKTIEDLLRAHPFLAEHASEHLALIAGCGENRHFKEGAYLAREGEPADTFFVIRSGHVAVEHPCRAMGR